MVTEVEHNKATFIITHRLSAVRHADRILVIDKGAIVQEGIHESIIIAEDGLYKHLYDLQFREGITVSEKSSS